MKEEDKGINLWDKNPYNTIEHLVLKILKNTLSPTLHPVLNDEKLKAFPLK